MLAWFPSRLNFCPKLFVTDLQFRIIAVHDELPKNIVTVYQGVEKKQTVPNKLRPLDLAKLLPFIWST